MSLSTVDRFLSSKLKIKRVQEHTRTLNNKIIDYNKSHSFKVVIEQDDNSHSNLWTLWVMNEIPYPMSAIIGDIIHNIRR
jgi:type III secretion system FlhB-like substrate exporter